MFNAKKESNDHANVCDAKISHKGSVRFISFIVELFYPG